MRLLFVLIVRVLPRKHTHRQSVKVNRKKKQTEQNEQSIIRLIIVFFSFLMIVIY